VYLIAKWQNAPVLPYTIKVALPGSSSYTYSIAPGTIYSFTDNGSSNGGYQSVRVEAKVQGSTGEVASRFNNQLQIFYASEPFVLPGDPVPTATPIPNNLCNTVQGEGSELNVYDFIPMPLIGTPSCAGWEEWYGGTIFGVEFTIPEVQICLTPIYFGNIQLFDMSISVDWFIYVMGFVAILRWFIRS